jgi:hypothetical protein
MANVRKPAVARLSAWPKLEDAPGYPTWSEDPPAKVIVARGRRNVIT